MIIKENLLLEHGVQHVFFDLNQEIFQEGQRARFYYQIVEGTVELTNYNDSGKEFTQNIISAGQCFGESVLFIDQPYPMSAVAKSYCHILKLSKTAFLGLLFRHPEISLNIFKCLAERLYYKSIMLFTISSHDPTHQLQTVMEYFRQYNSSNSRNSVPIPLSRKQLAGLTGLRIETVIRTIKKMERQNILRIEQGKIYYAKE